jgi:hypothetical protein
VIQLLRKEAGPEQKYETLPEKKLQQKELEEGLT